MIEGTLTIFELDYTFKIVSKTTTDAFYGKTHSDYVTQIAKAVIMPYEQSFQETDQTVGVAPSGRITIFIKGMGLKKDDMVVYEGRDYTIIEESRWNVKIGKYNVYIASI